MKAEDVAQRLRVILGGAVPMPPIGSYVLTWEHVMELARACEQHGIERAKAHGKGNIHVQSDGIRGRAWVDWSALDAEIEKENEDG